MTKNKALWDALTVWECNNTTHSIKMPQRAPGQSREAYMHNSSRAKAIKSSLRRAKRGRGDMSGLHLRSKAPTIKNHTMSARHFNITS